MTRGPSQDDELARARLRGRRAGLAILVVVAVAFIVSSTSQITRAVFGLGGGPVPAGAPGAIDPACTQGVKALLDARFSRVDSPAREVLLDACSRTPEGLDLSAALKRLKVAEEQLTRRCQAELSPLRRDVEAHLPADLR